VDLHKASSQPDSASPELSEKLSRIQALLDGAFV
jgi:hypothetical protein